jgi:hypothetical protein
VLCRSHLLGEHRELHAAWNVITLDRHGYRAHPEVTRWRGRLAALYRRHEALVEEMARRGYRHASPLDPALASGSRRQSTFVDPPDRQLVLLAAKGCECGERIAARG